MRLRILMAFAAILAFIAPSVGSARPHLPPRSRAATLLAAAAIAPNSTLIRDGEGLRALELDELAPLRLRLSIPF